MILSQNLDELKTMPLWVLWKAIPQPTEKDKDHIGKIPYSFLTNQALKGAKGSKEYMDQLGSFWEVRQTLDNTKEYNGIGLVMDRGLLGIDLDNCIDENGNISQKAQDIISIANTYTEYSPSKKGLRLLMYGTRPGTKQREGNLEIYDNPTNNYLTITGDILIDKPLNKENQKGIDEIYKKYFLTEIKETKTETIETLSTNNRNAILSPYTPTDEEIIQKILDNKKGFYLWTTTPKEHHSEDDIALCNLLAFYTGKDKERIDTLFRQSPLYRDKWEREDYREMTINKAINDLTSVYTWNDILQMKKDKPQKKENILLKGIENKKSISSFVDSMQTEIDYYKNFKEKKTGFSNMDSTISLYPGLYTIGGSSGTGKTTFCLQLANQLAQRKERVLYFTLEQSKLDLVSKSLSYEVSHNDPGRTINAMRIRTGENNETISQAKERYKKYCDYIDIIETNFTCTIEEIIEYIEHDISTGKEKPIIFIDYLQVIAPTDDRKTDKQIIEHIIKAIKNYQKEKGLIIFLISSVNRANYLLPTDLTSFKETGLIEFSSDMILGLDLQIVHNEKVFNTTGKEQEKRSLKNKAMTEYPRKVCLVILKNRYGQAYGQYNFDYYPSQERFVVDYSQNKQFKYDDYIQL